MTSTVKALRRRVALAAFIAILPTVAVAQSRSTVTDQHGRTVERITRDRDGERITDARGRTVARVRISPTERRTYDDRGNLVSRERLSRDGRR